MTSVPACEKGHMKGDTSNGPCHSEATAGAMQLQAREGGDTQSTPSLSTASPIPRFPASSFQNQYRRNGCFEPHTPTQSVRLWCCLRNTVEIIAQKRKQCLIF